MIRSGSYESGKKESILHDPFKKVLKIPNHSPNRLKINQTQIEYNKEKYISLLFYTYLLIFNC